MSKTGRINQRRGERGIPKTRQPRHITVRSHRREQPDLRKLARAIIAQALAEAEAEQASTNAPATGTTDTITAQAAGEEADHD